MNRNAKGLGFYLIVVLLILLLLTYFRGGLEASQSWNYDQLEEAITQEVVVNYAKPGGADRKPESAAF